MPKTIQFDRELAKEMQRELSDIMATYTNNENGSDYYLCPFCNRYAYLEGEAGRPYYAKEIEHGPYCLGMKMMKELDLRLNEEPVCATPQACEGVLMVHGVRHGKWCPLYGGSDCG